MSSVSTRKPKHRKILDTLVHEISTGQFRAGEKLPTEFVLADRFQVSRPTVARAVRELVRLGMVSRRAGQGTFVRQQASTDGLVFGLLVPELGDSEIFEPICGHIARSIQREGHVLQWADSNPNALHRQPAETAFDACRGFIERGVTGVFLAPFVAPPETENPNRSIVEALRKAGITVVLLDRDIVTFPRRSEFDLVAVDHLRGQASIAEFLVKQGHHRLAFWLWKHAANTIEQRSAGIFRALADAGLPVNPDLVQHCDPDDTEHVAYLIETHRPDAIMCANDVFAGHLMKTLEMMNVRVPQDLSVVGYDDVRYAHLLRVPLTTISQPCEQIGMTAVRLMLERIKHPELPPREVLVTPSLAVRESTDVIEQA